MNAIQIIQVPPVLVREEDAVAMLGKSPSVLAFLLEPSPSGHPYLEPATTEKRRKLYDVEEIRRAYAAARANGADFVPRAKPARKPEQ